MPSATPIFDALAEQMLGPLADFVPHLLIVGRTETPRSLCEGQTSGPPTPPEVGRLNYPNRASSPTARHRLL
ncbi:hypothetical protein FZ046_14025 [Mycolicibacterium grossiae]|nr:hypothetical protein FZ046_14025 [Mycolicibacterium grossiae]